MIRLKKSMKITAVALLSQLCGTSVFASESLKGEALFNLGGFTVTNSMLTTWIFALIIIGGVRLMLRGGAKLVPSNGQIVIESIIDALKGVLEPVMGSRAFKAAFPLLLGFFTFILIMNWSGLLPGVGSIGSNLTSGNVEKFVPYIRPADSDLNTTLALAIISFGAWFYFVMRFAGPKAFLHETFGNKADKKDVALPIYLSLFLVFFAVGCIDLISIVMRLLSLSFRLFGNTFGGEVLLANMHELAIKLPRFFSWLIPLPFYLLECLIGLIQAFLFTLLTAVYIGLLTGNEE